MLLTEIQFKCVKMQNSHPHTALMTTSYCLPFLKSKDSYLLSFPDKQSIQGQKRKLSAPCKTNKQTKTNPNTTPENTKPLHVVLLYQLDCFQEADVAGSRHSLLCQEPKGHPSHLKVSYRCSQ